MNKQWVGFVLLTTLSFSQLSQADEKKITVFAAASLTNALQDIAAQYHQNNHVSVIISFASSSTLARQIEAGAPADLFISADQQWMDYAANKNALQPGTRKTLLTNSLVVVAAQSSSLTSVPINQQTNWKNLLKDGRLAVGDPDHVPAGIYAKEALQKLGAWQMLSPKLAPAADVRAALALVERNEAPLGIVYGSDALTSKGVKVIGTFPESSHKKVEYPMAVVKDHANPTVEAFYHYLAGPKAAAIFQRYGFTLQQ